MLGKAFCGNGIIHLNIAEIYEEDIRGPEKVSPDRRSGLKMGDFQGHAIFHIEKIKSGSTRPVPRTF